jgi:hypothetical protein
MKERRGINLIIKKIIEKNHIKSIIYKKYFRKKK